MMKLPPYPKFLDKIPVVVKLTEGIDENGAPNVVSTYTGKCNFDESAQTVRDAKGIAVRLSGTIFIGCDIAPDQTNISGSATINSREYKIHRGSRLRNPDGSVHHTELELI